MLKTVRSTVNVDQITGVLPVVNGGTGVTTSTGTGSVVLSAAPTLSGNVGLSTGNIVPATAAKGINFTANTPAAGMTSQLLNNYEEGTWTPADASGAGLVLTTGTSYYTRVGRLVTASFVVIYPVTANAAQAYVSLPIASNGGGGAFIYYQTNGVTYTIYVEGTNNRMAFATIGGAAVANSSLSTFRFDGLVTYLAA
jgi:hypothetical protein